VGPFNEFVIEIAPVLPVFAPPIAFFRPLPWASCGAIIGAKDKKGGTA
jgi:hypothetical protein